MKKFNFKRTFKSVGRTLKKHSPEILIAAGVAGSVTGTVMACKATMKLGDILEEHNESLEDIKSNISEEPTKEEKKAITKTYAKTTLAVAKNYAPSVFVSGLSIASIITSNNILRKRNTIILGAYGALKKNYDDYTSRVIDKYGMDVHKEILYGSKEIEQKTKIKNEEGKSETIKTKYKVISDTSAIASPYAVVFDKKNPNFKERGEDFSIYFLEGVQNVYTAYLNRDGYVLWYDILKYMGFEMDQLPKAAIFAGWVKDSEDGDSFIDLGVQRFNVVDEEGNMTDEIAYILDPNVEGDITSKIWPKGLTKED